jgi:hypothetical protein
MARPFHGNTDGGRVPGYAHLAEDDRQDRGRGPELLRGGTARGPLQQHCTQSHTTTFRTEKGEMQRTNVTGTRSTPAIHVP